MSCEGCFYAVLLSGAWCCDYLLMTGRRRPCPPGEGCTVREKADLMKKGSTFMKRREWDTEKARTLYDQKLSDAEIAGRVGATASAAAFWRRGLGLPANPGQRPPPQKGPETKAAPPLPASPPPRPLALLPNGAPAGAQRSGSGGERREEWSGRSPRRRRGQSGVEFLPTKDPVELSIRLDNGKWELSIRAPDLKGVRDIYALAGLVLENMGQIPEQLKEETDDG